MPNTTYTLELIHIIDCGNNQTFSYKKYIYNLKKMMHK